MSDSLHRYHEICQCSLPELMFARFEIDSRKVDQQTVFVATKGAQVDARRFIPQAVSANAIAVLAEADIDNGKTNGHIEYIQQVPVISVANLSEKLAAVAERNYQHKQVSMKLYAVTGTNGKTSVAHLLQQSLQLLGSKAGYLGTLGVYDGDKMAELANTTPVAIELHNLLAQLDEKVTDCAIEVSSHAVTEKRIQGLAFDCAAFTNLSHDHLDFHGDMESYFAAKQALFTDYQVNCAVINVDDNYGRRLADSKLETKVVAVGMTDAVKNYSSFVHAQIAKTHSSGFVVKLTSNLNEAAEQVIQLPLLGEFNISNALVTFAMLLKQGYTLADIAAISASLKPIAGRMEVFSQSGKPAIVVDFAHTPDGLAHALDACRSHLSGKLWLVVGCGGDRDQEKRPVMGRIAQQHADFTVITNDNPRSENPMTIAKQIGLGFEDSNSDCWQIELDRKKAIQLAISQASNDDIVLIAGKGHETTQEIDGVKHPYDERAFVKSLMEAAA